MTAAQLLSTIIPSHFTKKEMEFAFNNICDFLFAIQHNALCHFLQNMGRGGNLHLVKDLHVDGMLARRKFNKLEWWWWWLRGGQSVTWSLIQSRHLAKRRRKISFRKSGARSVVISDEFPLREILWEDPRWQ